MRGQRRFLTVAGIVAAAGTAVVVSVLTLHASNAATDRYNAAHMRTPVGSATPGWNCTNNGCVTLAKQAPAAQ